MSRWEVSRCPGGKSGGRSVCFIQDTITVVDYGLVEESVWCTGAVAYGDYLVDEGTAWSQGIQTKNDEFNNKAY